MSFYLFYPLFLDTPEQESNYHSWAKSGFSSVQFSSVQFSSVAQSCPTLCDPMNCSTQASQSITNSQSSLRLTSIKSVMPKTRVLSSIKFIQHQRVRIKEYIKWYHRRRSRGSNASAECKK